MERLDSEAGLLQYVRKRGTFDGPMGRYHQLQCFVWRVLLEPNMATALPNDNPAVPTKCPNHLLVVSGSGPSSYRNLNDLNIG